MKKRIVALVLALVMVLGLVPSVAFAEEDGPIKIYMSVSNAGTLATCNDGEVMAFREVTVTDYDADDKITFHEALIAAHNTYFSGGAEAGYGDGGGFVKKIWGVENGGSYFFNQNGVSIPVGVMEQQIAENDYLTVCIMEDAQGFSDVANTYFKDASDRIVNRVEINAMDALELTLIGCVLDYTTWQTVPTALPNIAIGIWQDGFKQLDSLTTDNDGKVSVSFTQPGTYVLTAEGQFEDKTIMAPTCLVTVKDVNTPATPQDVSAVLNATMAQLAETVTAPTFGNEWTVLSLARGGFYASDNQYFTDYYKRIVDYVNETAASVNLNGALDMRKSTENSRLILALSAIGRDVTSVGDWNLITPYEDFTWITKQGINGPIFALLALDSHNYATMDATIRQRCINFILESEIDGGGWALSGKTADPDITAMALLALAKYKNQPDVKAAAERAFTVLSKIQKDNGGYASWGSVNSESIAQVIVAATAWGIDPDTDSRFVKNGKSAVDALLTFYVEDGHGFAHVLTSGGGYTGGKVDSMATDQACYALVAYDRFQNKKTALYDMSDVTFKCADHAFGAWTVTTSPTCTEGGTEKHTCTACGAEETRTVEAKGHTFGEWKETKAATRTETGLKTRTCSVCGATETQIIPALGQKPSTTKPGGSSKPAGSTVKSSDTGDSSQMTLWLGGVLLSAAALTVLTRKRKRSAE